MHHGQSYHIDIHFNEDVTDDLSLELCGYVGPVCVPFPIKAPVQHGKFFKKSNIHQSYKSNPEQMFSRLQCQLSLLIPV